MLPKAKEKILPRPLSDQESGLLQWLLENGGRNSKEYLEQLKNSQVISGCPCGCASIDLVDVEKVQGGMTILSDYLWKDGDGKVMGIFAFAYGDLLGGVEIVSYEGENAPPQLPNIESLYPWEKG